MPSRFRVAEVTRFYSLGRGGYGSLVEVGEPQALRFRARLFGATTAETAANPRLIRENAGPTMPFLVWDVDVMDGYDTPPPGVRRPEWCLDQVRRVADCVGNLHVRGVAHGRLDRNSVLLDRNGDLVVHDFGRLSPRSQVRGPKNGTHAKASAPECHRLVACADLASIDVFALGVLALELFADRPLVALTKQELTSITRPWPKPLRDCLSFSPTSRPRDLKVLAERLASGGRS